MPPEPRHRRVFISYSHDSDEHRQRVLDLANALRRQGIDAWIDRFEPWPAIGWPLWMERQIAAADRILVVCTPTYRKRFDRLEKAPGVGRGVAWEGLLLRNWLYEDLDGRLGRTGAVIFEGTGTKADIPQALSGQTSFSESADHAQLVAFLLGRPEVVAAPIAGDAPAPPEPGAGPEPATAAPVRSDGTPERPPLAVVARGWIALAAVALALVALANLAYRGGAYGIMQGLEIVFAPALAPFSSLHPAVWRGVLALAAPRWSWLVSALVGAGAIMLMAWSSVRERVAFQCVDQADPSRTIAGKLAVGDDVVKCDASESVFVARHAPVALEVATDDATAKVAYGSVASFEQRDGVRRVPIARPPAKWSCKAERINTGGFCAQFYQRMGGGGLEPWARVETWRVRIDSPSEADPGVLTFYADAMEGRVVRIRPPTTCTPRGADSADHALDLTPACRAALRSGVEIDLCSLDQTPWDGVEFRVSPTEGGWCRVQ